MKKWKVVKLDEVFDVYRGGSPRPIDKFITDDPNGLNWIMIGDAVDGSKYIERTAKKIKPEGLKKTRAVNVGDFLLTNSMSFGRPYILKTNGCIHDGWLVLKPRSDEISRDFFYYYLGSDQLYTEFTRLASGAVVKNLNSDLVRNVKIPLPPLDEQKRIADILDKADELRQKRKQAIAKLDELIQSVFLDMFGDPVTNPKGWEVKRLGDFASKIGSGATPRGGEESYKSEGISLIRSMNVQDGIFKYKDLAFIDDAQAMLLQNVMVEENDVLLNITGASVARVCRAPANVLPARVNQHVCIIRPKQSLSSAFLEHLLLSPSMKGDLLRIGESGATRQAITKGQIESLPILYPPISIQRNFSALVESLQRRRIDMTGGSTALNTLFNSLQQRAFKGEL